MAQAWLLQALYTSLLSSVGNRDTDLSPEDTMTVLANTSHGTIVGAMDNTAQPTVHRYLGVPFARPPIGSLRFQAPVNPDPWAGVRSALQPSPQCWQADIPSEFSNSEDCLYLNIYTPARDSDAGLLPVMVWIHGGSYIYGTGSKYNGTLLARKGGVVVVTINYRLDVFGFLSTEDEELPGNYGLLDQIQALRWVSDNIQKFGGDPNAVTIFGESSGGGSVSLLVLSPLAKGLFHRAIMESGVSLSPWAFKHTTQRVSPAYGAKLVGIDNGCDLELSGSKAFANCLRRVDAESLYKSGANVTNEIFWGSTLWMLPRAETTFGVIPEEPIQILSKGNFAHVDTMRGFNSHESGPVMIRWYTVDVQNRSTFVESVIESLSPWAFLDIDKLSKEFETFYIKNATADALYFAEQASQSSSDFYFASSIVREISLDAIAAPEKNHYLYRFDYRTSYSQQPSWVGAVHGDELRFLFGIGKVGWTEPTNVSVQGNAEDLAMLDKMITMWSNFAKTGTPSISGPTKWEPFTFSKPCMMTINSASRLVDFSRSGAVDLFERVMHLSGTNAQPLNDIIG